MAGDGINIQVTGLESGGTWHWKYGSGGTWSADIAASTNTFTPTLSGNYYVEQTDKAGNVSGTVSYAPPIKPSWSLAVDSGSSPTDYITNNGTVNVVNNGLTWQYSTNGGSSWSSTQAAATTSFTLSGDATYNVQIKTIDGQGAQLLSNSQSVTLDTVYVWSDVITYNNMNDAANNVETRTMYADFGYSRTYSGETIASTTVTKNQTASWTHTNTTAASFVTWINSFSVDAADHLSATAVYSVRNYTDPFAVYAYNMSHTINAPANWLNLATTVTGTDTAGNFHIFY